MGKANKQFKEKIHNNRNNMGAYSGYMKDANNHKPSYRKPKAEKPERPATTTSSNTSRPAKKTPVSYTKTYSSETYEHAFYEALVDLATTTDVFDALIRTETGEVFGSIDLATANVAEVMATMAPKLLEKRFIHSVFSMTANKVTVRTESGLGFSWEVQYSINKETKTAEIDSVTLTLTLFTYDDDKLAEIESLGLGWEKVEKRNNFRK